MSINRMTRALLGIALAAAIPTHGVAGDLFSGDLGSLLRNESVAGETISIEPIVGWLRGTSTESVYDTDNGNARLSRLDWKVDALAVGARVAVRPIDWLTLRGRFWATVASTGTMTDYDWFLGYYGPSSWTHKSVSPDTDLGKAWQGDISAAFKLYDGDDLAVTAIAGYRHYDIKYNARGGSYIYSSFALRDTIGEFPAGQLGISYEQVWQTPYLGVGAVYNSEDWTASIEVVGSPFVMGRSRDNHALRTTLFKDDFDTSGMVGLNAGFEYRLTPVVSLAGRVDYQRYFEARGGTKAFNSSTGQAFQAPKPGAGADADTLLVSLGIKTRL